MLRSPRAAHIAWGDSASLADLRQSTACPSPDDYLIGQTPGLSFETFVADGTRCRAFVRSLEIIGEAAKKVSPEFRAQYPEVEWRAMVGRVGDA